MSRWEGGLGDPEPLRLRIAELERQLERYRLATHAGGVATWEFDLRTDRLYSEPAVLAWLGIPPAHAPRTGAEWQPYHHPDEWPWIQQLLQDHLAGSLPEMAYDHRLLNADGSYRWVRSRGQVVRDDAGNPLKLIGTISNIHESKRTEQALRTNEERYRELFEANPLPMVIFDQQDLQFLAVNDAALEQYGYSRHEFLARTLLDIRPPEDVPRIRAILASHEHLPYVGTVRHLRRDGTILDVQTSSHPIVFGGRPARVALFLDVTEQKRRETTLRHLAAIVESSEDAICSWGPDGTLTSWNAGAEKLYGYPSVEALGKTALVLAPPEREDEILGILDRVAQGKRVDQLETVHRAGDGRLLHVALTVSPIRTADGQFAGASMIARDITRRKALEEQLRQAQKMEAVGRLAGGVAHDFNNLLTVIAGYTEMLLIDRDPKDPALDFLHEVRKAAERATALTRQLLAFSRKQILAPIHLHLNSLVQDLEKLLRRLIGEDVVLVCHYDRTLGPVKADPGQLEQVVMNLVLNARDAMPGGGRVVVETRNVNLGERDMAPVPEMPPGRYALLSIQDTGHGMDANTLAQIFEPFFTTKEVGRGTGLGLATVYGIVKQSGGHIGVRSAPGEGTTFSVYLPITDEQPTARKTDVLEQRTTRGSETVLLVEDEEGVRELAQVVLESSGYRLLTARDGRDALEQLQRHGGPLHLLVSDVVMPGMTGPQLAQCLLTWFPRLRVLYLSGYTGDALMRHGVMEEGISFLQKPFRPLTLAQRVRELLDTGAP